MVFRPDSGRRAYFFVLSRKGAFVYEGTTRKKIRQEALGALESVKDAGELDALRVRFLGKKGELTGVLKTMGKLSAEERPRHGSGREQRPRRH